MFSPFYWCLGPLHMSPVTGLARLCTSQIEASTFPPGHPPGHLNFWKVYENSPLTGPKSCLNAPTSGKITRILFKLFSTFYYASEAVHVNMVY